MNRKRTMHTFTTSDDVRIAYYIDDFTDPWKTPPVLLMLHSGMGSSKRFYSMVPGLMRHCRVVRADTRGHGNSQIPPATLPVDKERLMLDLVELLDHLRLDKVHMLGNSAGGFVAQQLAIHRPERVKSLILYGSAPGLKGEQAKHWLKEAAQRGMRAFFTETISDRFPVGEVDQRLLGWFIDEICKNDLSYIARFVGYWTDTFFMEEVRAIQCPTLIVAPGAEPIGSALDYPEMVKRINRAEMIVYEGARHNICDYLPDRCVDDALKFLKKHFPSDF